MWEKIRGKEASDTTAGRRLLWCRMRIHLAQAQSTMYVVAVPMCIACLVLSKVMLTLTRIVVYIAYVLMALNHITMHFHLYLKYSFWWYPSVFYIH